MREICEKCRSHTLTRQEDGRFLHVGCFDAWWSSEYGDNRGSYYRWMRQGMCAR